jgi:sec-independent protein translocase protein TatB
MFGIGAGELLVIFIIAIVVIGPRQLPEVARTIGKVFVTLKRTGNQLRDQMHEEVRKFQEMDEIKEFKATMESEIHSVKNATEEYVQAEIGQEEQRFKDEAKNLETELMAEAGPVSRALADPFGTAAAAAPEESVERPAAAAAEPAGTVSESPVADASPANPPAKGANGGTPGHPGAGEPAAAAVPDKSI